MWNVCIQKIKSASSEAHCKQDWRYPDTHTKFDIPGHGMATQRYKWVGLAHHCHVPSACVCCVLVHTFHLPVCAPIWIFNVILISIPTIFIALFASFSYKHTITIIPCLTNGVNQAWHHPLLCSWHPLLAVWQVFCRLKPNIRPSWSGAPEQDRREAMLSGSGFGAMKIYRKWQIVFSLKCY